MKRIPLPVKLGIGFSVFIVVCLLIIRIVTHPDDTIITPRSIVDSVLSTPSPTPVPFKELTIPYLRERNYVSSLGERRVHTETSTYTSYVTSYVSDDLTINGLLTIPKGEQPANGWPAIVFVHGYIPPTLYRTTEKYESYVDYLARNGFVVFKIDLRGHGSSEGTPSGAYYSGDYIIDTLNAVAALQSSEFVDKERIGLWGHSMGGNVTFRSFVAAQDIKALVIWAGAVYTYDDLSEYRIQDNSYRPPSDNTARQRFRDELNAAHGSFTRDSAFWKSVVPTNYLDGVKGALQIHHATDDSVVSVLYSRNLLDQLSNSDIPGTLYEYPTGGHNITGASFTQAMQRTVEFYRTKL